MQLVNTAYYYKKKHKRPIVLVIDQVDRIAERDPNFLSILQDFAKDNSDTRSIIVVFVASESLISQLQQSRSAWSRAIIPLEIDDIPDEQAVKFLQDFNVDPKIAEYAVKYLTGGRFALLKNFHSIYKINPGENSLKKSKEILFWQIEGKLFTVGLPTNHEFFRKLIEVHRIDIEEAESYIPLDMIRKLVKVNILKEHQDYTVSFHSRYIDTYFKEGLQVTSWFWAKITL